MSLEKGKDSAHLLEERQEEMRTRLLQDARPLVVQLGRLDKAIKRVRGGLREMVEAIEDDRLFIYQLPVSWLDQQLRPCLDELEKAIAEEPKDRHT